MQYQFYIGAMDCAEEVSMLKRAFSSIVNDTETQLRFDLLNAKFTISLPEDSKLAESEIIAMIGETGMSAVSWSDHANNGSDANSESFWNKNGRQLMCSASGALLIAGFAIHAISSGVIASLVEETGSWASFPFATLLLYICATITGVWYVLPKAIYSIRSFRPDMNALMIFAIIGAFILGELLEGAMIAVLFAISLLLESWSVGRARKAIGALINYAPKTARVQDTCCGGFKEIPVDDVAADSVIIVRSGEKIPVDGTIIKGSSDIDQSPITGESKAIAKELDDAVFAGSIVIDGVIEIRVTNSSENSTIARIIRMVEEAQSRKAKSEQWVEKFAVIYTPAMLGIATALAIIPPMIIGGGWGEWFYKALVILVIGCPCALVISTPVSIVAALASSARAGILIKGGAFLETFSQLRAMAFDKTGTLSVGLPEVKHVIPVNGQSEAELLEIIASLESQSTHALADAITAHADSKNIKYSLAENIRVTPGKGIEGTIGGKNYWLGSHRFLHEKADDHPWFHDKADALEEDGYTVVTVGNERNLCGLVALSDTIRPEAREVVVKLKKAVGGHIILLTGDNEGTAKHIADETDVDECYSELLPEDKVKHIEQIIEKYGAAAMIGDGINDAPALATASIGVAMGGMGTDVAIETADITLMSDDLMKLPWLMRHSKRTVSVIKQNIIFALTVKFVFTLMAALGYATLWMAIAADMGASLLVIFNALRLLQTNYKI